MSTNSAQNNVNHTQRHAPVTALALFADGGGCSYYIHASWRVCGEANIKTQYALMGNTKGAHDLMCGKHADDKKGTRR